MTKPFSAIASVIQFMVFRILKPSVEYAREERRKFIRPKHIKLPILLDPEMEVVFRRVHIPNSSVLPQINKFLVTGQARRSSGTSTQEEQEDSVIDLTKEDQVIDLTNDSEQEEDEEAMQDEE